MAITVYEKGNQSQSVVDLLDEMRHRDLAP